MKAKLFLASTLFALLTACSGLQPVEPVVYQVPETGGSADLVLSAQTPEFPTLPVVHAYPVHEPLASVVLVHGLGTNAAIWDLPETGRLARRIWRAGYAVYAVDLNFTRGASSLRQAREKLRVVLKAILRKHRQKKVIGVGFDIGGTLLYQILHGESPPLHGVVGMGAQVGFGGYSRALKALFQGSQAGALTWPMLDGVTLVNAPNTEGGISELLLSSTLPEKSRFAFYRLGLAGMPRTILTELATLGQGHHVPVLDPVLAGRKTTQELPMLAIMAPGDGLAPPWQCDLGAFGLDHKLSQSVYLTRANGESMEFNHLDLLLHPAAEREVFPLVMDWLAEQVR